MTQNLLAPPDTPARLAAVRRTALLDTPAEPAFDRLTRLAARLLGAPISIVSLVDQDRQFYKSATGLPEPLASRRAAPLSYSFCPHVARSGEPLVVDDARRDPLTRQNVAVRELGWISYLGFPLVTRDGQAIGAMSVIDTMPRLWSERDLDLLRDLAASVVTEIELRSGPAKPHGEEEEPFAEVFDEAGTGIAILSLDGRCLRVNRPFADLLGYPPEELLGRTMASLTDPDDVPAEQDALTLLRLGECPSFQLEKRFRHQSGQVVWALVNVAIAFRPDGEQDHLVAVVQDLTERKRTELALEAREERHRLAARTRREVIRDWNLSTDELIWVAEPDTLFGHAADTLGATAAGWYERVHPGDRERVVASIAQAVARGDRGWADEYQFRRADGSYAHVSDRATISYDMSGTPTRLIASMVETLSRTDERLREAQKMEAVGQLAGGIAHDFNNLLTGILSYCDLILQEVRQGDPIRADIEQIRQAGQRAATLTRQLLAFSRRQILQPRILSLNGVIADLDGMLRRVLGASVTLETELDPGVWYVLADPGQIEQVLVNLVVNARDAMPDGGRVTIATTNERLDRAAAEQAGSIRAGEYVVLSVADTGIGMNPETQARIFEPFFTTKEPGRGTGLGLSTVYGIVQQSGGHITVESAPGAGAVFRIYLPRHAAPGDAAPRSDRRALPRGTETLLLVEDEAAVRASARRLLERHGYVILEARHGADALRIFESNQDRIQLVLTDVVMPEMGGRELVERLRAYRPSLKVLFMSGYTEKAITTDGTMPPNTGFLEKPFTIESLIRRVREVLDGTRALP